jgi:hypothetical protein
MNEINHFNQESVCQEIRGIIPSLLLWKNGLLGKVLEFGEGNLESVSSFVGDER